MYHKGAYFTNTMCVVSYSRPDGDDNGDGGHGDHVEREEEVLDQPVHALPVHLGQTAEPGRSGEKERENR